MPDIPGIDVKRVESDIYKIAEFGAVEGERGVYRQGFTEADWQARQWLLGYFKEHGLDAHIDGAGNVCGRYGPADQPAVIIASHLDSVPAGGIFDGTLGIVAGLECIRVIKEAGLKLNAPIELIATSEEEGRFGGMLGAQALTGKLTLDWLEQARDPKGERLTEAMAKCDLNYHDALTVFRAPDSVKAFIELHIEQGPVLEAVDKCIGVVEGISGVYKWLVKLKGKADHAGTAPMDLRSDAFMGLADFAHEIKRLIAENGTDKTRLTIGYVKLKPGYAHTVPGEVEFTIVGRDMSEEVMKDLADSSRKALSAIARSHGLMFEYEQMSWLAPKAMSNEIMAVVEEQTKKLGYSYQLMPSGAGHDAQFFADITPAGMIFIPSVNGVSHAPDEWTHWPDVEKGCNVLLHSVLALTGVED
ncbi:Zn-dependent hydrolase [Pseudomaricurvus alcaniphilus]|uniref:Zn-dependent hydrolase n=1 Tax=Pseudomaricurvus alcaniphilus TaxID=1166482 RepID=UPI001A9FD674|nr:Zn-dependent hydrolase [Pseudomaricurvus alcaniphilus]